MIVGQDKPSLSELAHYGVKGMHWGITTNRGNAATKAEATAARRNLKKKSTQYRKDFRRYDKLKDGSPAKAALEAKLRKQHEDYLKDPERIIAARMTRGEKFSTGLLSTPGGLASMGIAAASIATTSVVSRRIDYKQKTGAYNKSNNQGELKSHLGLQKTRALTLYGASAAPTILSITAAGLSGSILARAAANRDAAKVFKPLSIGSIANALKYVKPKGGVHTITTLK